MQIQALRSQKVVEIMLLEMLVYLFHFNLKVKMLWEIEQILDGNME